MSVRLRPMTVADAGPLRELSERAFEDLHVREGGDPWPSSPTPPEVRDLRFSHIVGTDPGGCWIAEDGDGKLLGGALAIMREGIWGLSSLTVDPGAQSAGVGRELLERAVDYGKTMRGGIILSSSDWRALRAYSRAGFDLVPTFRAQGPLLREAKAQAGIRVGTADDFDALERVSRGIRGGSHRADFDVMVKLGWEPLVAEGNFGIVEGSFCFHKQGVVGLLCATGHTFARALLETAFSSTPPGKEAFIAYMDQHQQWAVRMALRFGLRIQARGAMCVRGGLGDMAPFLPSGAFL